MTRKHIPTLRAREPGVKFEIRRCPSHQGTKDNEVADEWAKLAADEPGAHGMEWFSFRDPCGQVRKRRFLLPRSLARKQKTDPKGARDNKRLAPRFHQLKTGHRLTGQYLHWTTRRLDTTCWWCQYKIQTREHLFKNRPQWKGQQKTLWATVLEETTRLPGPHHGAVSRLAVQPAMIDFSRKRT